MTTVSAGIETGHCNTFPHIIPECDMNQPLTLTPTRIVTYLKCPRQYFYRYLLDLKEERVRPQTIAGTLIHRILEGVHRHSPAPRRRQHVLQYTRLFFEQSVFDWPELEDFGFCRQDMETLQQLPLLQRQQVRQQVELALTNLIETGYFEDSYRIVGVEVALALENPFGLKDIRLTGRVDLIREQADGSLEIVDFKTTRQKYRHARHQTNLRPLLDALAPINWQAPHYQRYCNREYQLPLYWLMASSLTDYQGRKIHASLQLVRPAGYPGSNEGALTLTLDHDTLNAGKPHIQEMILKGIIAPMREEGSFLPLGHPRYDCPYCPYGPICKGSPHRCVITDAETQESPWPQP